MRGIFKLVYATLFHVSRHPSFVFCSPPRYGLLFSVRDIDCGHQRPWLLCIHAGVVASQGHDSHLERKNNFIYRFRIWVIIYGNVKCVVNSDIGAAAAGYCSTCRSVGSK